jgi:hypothetical protein
MITLETYTRAVLAAVKLVLLGTGGSRIMAQVLLSAYDGENYQLDVSDLLGLDSRNYAAAITIIRGRCELRTEPHEVIEGGDKLFEQMWHDWSHLHVKNRGKSL